MRHPVQTRVRMGLYGAGTLLASVALAYVAQRPAPLPGLVDALAPVVAVAAYVAGMTGVSAALFGLRTRGVLWTAVGWVAALLLVRLAVEPGVVIESVGRLPDGVVERWAVLSTAGVWFVAVPLDVVFGAATCGALLAVLALATRPQPATEPVAAGRWGALS